MHVLHVCVCVCVLCAPAALPGMHAVSLWLPCVAQWIYQPIQVLLYKTTAAIGTNSLQLHTRQEHLNNSVLCIQQVLQQPVGSMHWAGALGQPSHTPHAQLL